MTFRLIALFLAITAFNTPQASAQGHGIYCEQADSTAATQACLKRHLDTAQKRLKTVYDNLNAIMDDEKRQELTDLQKSWLAYRDAECMWEAENAENPSLKRTNELSCMARLTDDRADILTIAHDDKIELGKVREYGSFPRWMNVVAQENKDIYWNYGGRKGFDLDCDGEDEYVMSGFKTEAVKIDAYLKEPEEGEEEKSLPHSVFKNHMTVSISQNPSVGKPTAQIFKFLVSDDEGKNNICSHNMSVSFAEGDVITEDNPTCNAKLIMKTGNCEPKTIIWTGKDFDFEPEEIIEAEENSEK